MNDDKAIRAAKLTLGGILEKNRAKEAKERAPGQIAPSKYMPNVPRAVHAAGGYVPAPMMQNTPRLAVAKAPIQSQQPEADFLASMQSLTDTAKSFTGKEEAPATAPEPHAARAEPHGYGEGISAAAAKAMSGLQGAWGGPEFGIVSGYRDPDQNAAAKGAKDSQHLHGNAFDVDTTGWSPEDKLALADAAWEQGFRGFGFYDNNMHFDVGAERGWGPSFSRDSIPEWAQGWTANRYGYADGGRIGGKDAFMQGNHPLVPKVLYHGTARDIRSFDPDAKRSYDVDPSNPGDTDTGWFGKGHYFTPSAKLSAHYADEAARRHGGGEGANIMPVHVAMKNPFVVNMRDYDSGAKTLDSALTGAGVPMHSRGWRKPSEQTAALISMGHDGVIATREGKPEEYVAFHPHQIKSAIGNQGAFDPGNPDITKSEGGGIGDNDNFANWFGNSVTHTDGEPHVFYTGTSKDKDFTSFNVGRHGAWFTRDPEVASSYADQNDSQGYKREGWNMVPTNTASRVIPAYVKAENPYTGPLPPETLRDNYKAAQSDWFDTLRAKGHDAWIPADQGGNLVVALKEPHQIKSVYNNGKFDPNQKHMNKADGGSIGDDDGITAYHGSPHDFDQFDIGKLGTGEGNQSFGHGLYFAGNEGVAKSYKKGIALNKNQFDIVDKKTKEPIDPSTPGYDKVKGFLDTYAYDMRPGDADHFKETMDRHKQSAINSINDYRSHAQKSQDPEWMMGEAQRFEDDLHHFDAAKTLVDRVKAEPKGHMYKVKLNVQPHELLDWDKPLSEQHPKVQEALSRMDPDQWHPSGSDYDPSEMGQISYHRIVSAGNRDGAIGEHLGPNSPPMKRGDKWASEALMENGIKGIRYLDAGSRGTSNATGSHNYVMFHHDPVKVTDKYEYGGVAKADGGSIGDAPDIQNPMSIFPKPQRMFPEDQRPPGGQYLSMPNKADVTGHKAETAHIGVGLDGKPFFRASQNAVDQTGSTGTGTANVKTNLFKQKAGWRWSQAPEGHENTQTIVSVEHRGKHYYALNAHFPKGVDLARYENATSEPRLRPTTRGNVDLGPQAGSITVRGREHPVYHHVIVKADGGAVERALGGRTVSDHGLYSRAAEIIRGLPQEKNTVDQYIAAAKKLGAKPSEIEHAGRPEGDKISREDMAKHFDRNLPKMEVHQYGENPSYLSKEQEKRLYEMWNKPKSEAEQAEYDLLMRRTKGPQVKYETDEMTDDNEPRPTEYQDYTIPGGSNYRERLLTLPSTDGKNDYMSNHWSDDSNVLAHIRMSDRTMGGDRESMRPAMQKLADHMGVGIRDLGAGSAEVGVKNGVVSPEEAASISRLMRWSASPYYNKPGLDKRILHIEEMQSDWGQEGREKGFYDPKNPYEIFDTKTGNVVSKHPSQDAMWDAYRAIPEDQAAGLDYGHASHTSEKKPAAPYVQNTQHWTDLALKNILHEAAMGGYDHIVFSPGQAQVDRYGLDKKLDRLQYMPQQQSLHGFKGGASVVYKEGVKPEDLPGMVGKDLTNRLLHPDNTFTAGANQFHELKGDDLKMGGQGMKGYYDNILPKSAMNLVKEHDPDIKPGSMPLSDQYTGFSIPMTDKLRQGILAGQPALKRGGAVEKSIGGSTDGQQDTAGTSQARPEAGGLPISGGVRGSSGVFPSQGETPLEGLPQNVRIPLTGGSLQAGPDPRIREIARQYMASSGLPYNPPTKYAKVDPGRSKRIAVAYDAMTDNPDDPLTKASYNALAKETMAQYQAAKAAGFKAEFWHPSKQEDPYKASPRLAVEDVRNNHHMWVYPTYAGYGSGEITDEDVKKNPMLQGTGEHWNGIPVTVNDVFRAIHDYYGHAKEGVGFRADGEENAWRAHASMFSPLARMAMTSETRGQNSWLNYGPHGEANRGARTEDTIFAPQKVGIMPDWVHHEGAEDFVTPEDVAELKRVRAKHSFDFEKALGITRSFTKDGKAATMRLKLKE